jgi:hypothetical protein
MAFTVPDLKIDAEQAFSFDLLIVDSDGDPVDVTEFTFTAQIKSAATGGSLLESFTITDSASEAGVVTLSLTANEVAALPFDTAYWDLRKTDDATGLTEVSEKAMVFLATPITEEPA